MVPTVHQHVRINGRPGIILAIDDTGPVWPVLVLWPGLRRPAVSGGQPRPGSWPAKFAVLAYHAADATWHANVDQSVSVQEHTDPLTQIDHAAWFEAFAQACHAAAR